MSKFKQQDGFTLLELMIATIIFSIILMATATMLLQVGRMYYKGVIVNRTQETTRTITDTVSQQLQFGADRVSFGPDTPYGSGTPVIIRSVCIGTQRYSYAINGQVKSSAPEGQRTAKHEMQHGLWRDTISSGDACTPLNLTNANPGGTNGKELLSQNMRLTSFSINEDCNTKDVCTFTIGVIYGDDDLLVPDADNPTGCGNVAGSQWCAASNLKTQVFKRLEQAG